MEEEEGSSNDNDTEIKSSAEEVENTMNEALNEFNTSNEEVDESVNDIEENCEKDNDETPVRRNRRAPSDCEPSFDDQAHAQTKEDDKVDDHAFVTISMKVFQQMSFEKGIREFGEQAEEALTEESTQLHMWDTFMPRFKIHLLKTNGNNCVKQ